MDRKRIRKFRPFKIPRYLPGSVKKPVWKNDLDAYNEHRYRVFTVEPRVDDSPPRLNPLLYVNAQRLTADALRLIQLNKENAAMLKKISLINRTGGYVDTFNPIAYERRSNWRRHELIMKQIDKDNLDVYKKIFKAKSEYIAKDLDENWEHMKEKIKNSSKYPIVVFGQKTIDQQLKSQPSISNGLGQKQIRPKCYLDIRVKNGVYLGRLIIELYQDYVPVTVQNFLSICRNQNGLSYQNCPIHKIFPGKYLETGDITKGNGKGGMSVYGKTFPEENFQLNHTKAGVLAMKRFPGKCNNSQFRITFDKMPQFNGNEVVFGRIVKGNSVLFKIQDLGRPHGVPIAPTIIMETGEFITGKTSLYKKNVYGFERAI